MFSVYIYLAGLLTGVSIAYTLVQLYDLDNHEHSEPPKKVTIPPHSCECKKVKDISLAEFGKFLESDWRKKRTKVWSAIGIVLGALVSYLKGTITEHY